jgi:Uncharacterised nucleotidyltransferase
LHGRLVIINSFKQSRTFKSGFFIAENYNKLKLVELIFTEEEKRWRILKFKVLEYQIENAFKIFRENGLEPILIKGWAVSRKYPEKYMRFFSDIDLAVAPESYQKALELVEKHQLLVDLHCGLRHLDTSDWSNLYENSITEKLNVTDVRMLCEEDHLRVLCVHWLTDGGAYREKLWDIFYAVENRRKKFDWNRCLNVVSAKRRLWIIYTIGLANRYLHLDISQMDFREEALTIPRWIIKTVEKEWASSVRLRPIHSCLDDRREVFRQILKRIPPNPIQATVEMEGDFNDKARIFFQLRSVLNRSVPSYKRIRATLSTRKK